MYYGKIKRKKRISKTECAIRPIVHLFFWALLGLLLPTFIVQFPRECYISLIIAFSLIGIIDGALNSIFDISLYKGQVIWIIFFMIGFLPVYYICGK